MTFAEVYTAMRAEALRRGESACLHVERWQHDHYDDHRAGDLEWRIYSHGLDDHFRGATGAEALAKYVASGKPEADEVGDPDGDAAVEAPQEGASDGL